MLSRSALREMIERHRLLDDALIDKRDGFVSDWNGSHPFVEQFLGTEIMTSKIPKSLLSRYIFFDEEHAVVDAICHLHLKLEGLRLSRKNIVAGPGSSSLLVALSLWVLQQGYSEVYYVPPLYYTLHYFLRMLGIRLRPVSGKHLFESNSIMHLPNRRGVLLLCDPIWYAGRRVPMKKIERIAEWQRKTRSLVLVDGAFQYMQWDGTRHENCALLDPELTFRLISPTKSLAVPCYRFAYVLHPSNCHDEFAFLYENLVGGASVSDLAFALRALDVLGSDESNRRLTTYLHSRYQRLVEEKIIQTSVLPDSGYFIFAVPTVRVPGQIAMDQEYFELKGYSGYVRMNLLTAVEIYLKQDRVESQANLSGVQVE
jgi:aspartate/methionine/tyrosine aminotransferase